MMRFTRFAALGALPLALAACDSASETVDGADAASVEEPAEAALEPVTEAPVEDPEIEDLEAVEGPPAVSEATAKANAEEAAAIAAEAQEAADAAAAAEEAGNALDDLDGIID